VRADLPDDQVVTVGRGPRDDLRPYDAARAGPVVDDDLLAPPLAAKSDVLPGDPVTMRTGLSG
jgi:hypothetical protein